MNGDAERLCLPASGAAPCAPLPSCCRRCCCGAVLIDVLTSVGFALLVIGIAHSWARAALLSQRAVETRTAADQEVHLALAVLSREIRDAGGGVAPIVAARTDLIEVQADLNGDGDTDDSFERVRYAHRPDRRQVTRAAGAGTPQPFLENVPAGGLAFSFHGEDGGEIAALPGVAPADLGRVRRVDVRLRVEAPGPQPRNTAPVVAEVAASVALRNR